MLKLLVSFLRLSVIQLAGKTIKLLFSLRMEYSSGFFYWMTELIIIKKAMLITANGTSS
jgi:hypothetical protein